MSDDASPYFVRPHRFDPDDQDDRGYPQLDRHHRVLLDAGEQTLWRGRVEVAGYLLGPSLGNGTLHWSLLRPADVTVTDRRLAFVCENWDFEQVTPPGEAHTGRPRHRRRPEHVGSRTVTGQIRWQWPGRLHLLPAGTDTGNGPASHRSSGGHQQAQQQSNQQAQQGSQPERLLLVCDSLRTIRQPGLALGAGDLGAPGAARELLHLVRRSIARFRLGHPGTPELSAAERQTLTVRAGAGPFAEELADPRRGITLPGGLVVEFTHRDDYHRRSARGSFSARRTPQAGTAGSAGLRRSRHPGSAS
ncbi:hypothetical protein OG792_25700 [Micromonospora sp. NBC_01699]|uniref:hypothetical protein n=1 Tax=Micromonospora sp. NBC_01699 TaxID=2975984 RepID=UPI002E2DB293|nr:hypothetical protein [Micromonospora sp. NBC_01699]